MAKKGVFCAALFIVAAYAALPYTYEGMNPIYPAVYHAIATGKENHWYYSKVVVNSPQEVVVSNVQYLEGLRVVDFTLRISLEFNELKFYTSNLKQRPIINDTWRPAKDFSKPDTIQFFIQSIINSFQAVMDNDALFERVKEAADKDSRVTFKR